MQPKTTGCTMACAGNTAQMCGGPSRNTVFEILD